MTKNNDSFKCFRFAGMALDPIHAGTGGSRLGRVDNAIVRDPVTRIPKIPGSSLAGVMRAYAAMEEESHRDCKKRQEPYYPNCAGQGQTANDGQSGHCCKPDCKVCTVFGYAKGRAGEGGGFAGLAAFGDMHVLLFPVPSQLGPQWITCPMALRQMGLHHIDDVPEADTLYRKENTQSLNLGWLLLPVKTDWNHFNDILSELQKLKIPKYITEKIGFVSDKLFSHIVNNNLEVRTSVAINPATGAAEDKALFTYEAIPRSTVLIWEVTCRNPKHFKIEKKGIEAVKSPDEVQQVIAGAHPYLEHLGIGGMGSRGMGRLRVLENTDGCDDNGAGKGDV